MSQDTSLRAQTLALAGVTQYALYTHELAVDGRDREERSRNAQHAILCTDPDQALDVFGDVGALGDGIRLLRRQLGGRERPPDPAAAMVGRYTGQILRLSAKLRRRPQYLERLRCAIERARLAEPDQTSQILNTAYQETISLLRPRLVVHGHPSYLKNPVFAERVRVFLLAAMRSAVLWRQSGGGLLRLILQRRVLLADLHALEQRLADAPAA